MNIVSAVANLQKELDYYKAMAVEQREIVHQLVFGPRDVEYINPQDLTERWKTEPLPLVNAAGMPYKASFYIPARTKNIR